MKRKVLSVLLCAGLAVSMLAGCGSDSSNANKKAESTGSDLEYVKDKGTLVVGVTDFEPMDYKDDNGEWVGFYADMAKAFAESIGVEAEFVEIDWDNKELGFYSLPMSHCTTVKLPLYSTIAYNICQTPKQ